jgi:hypothetical protein
MQTYSPLSQFLRQAPMTAHATTHCRYRRPANVDAPPDAASSLAPAYARPPVRTRAHHFECKPGVLNPPRRFEYESVILNTSPLFSNMAPPFRTNSGPSFRIQPHRFECKPVISNTSPFFSNASPPSRTRPHRLNASPSFRTQARCRTWPHHFEQMRARHFGYSPTISNASPSFRKQAYFFEHEPTISNTTPSF